MNSPNCGEILPRNEERSPFQRNVPFQAKYASFTWTISNFSRLPFETGGCLLSEVFSTCNNSINWKLSLFPRGNNARNKHFISVFLTLVTSLERSVLATFKISLLDSNVVKASTREMKELKEFLPGNYFGFQRYLSTEYLFRKTRVLLCRDELKLCCEVRTISSTVSSPAQLDLILNASRRTILEIIQELLQNEIVHDVMIIVKGTLLPAHKAILSIRSPVFRAMFTSRSTQNTSNEVNITDIEPHVAEGMLRYIYTGNTESLEPLAINLLCPANKYQLEGLKSMCEKTLSDKISIENAADILYQADESKADKLQSAVVTFINFYFNSVSLTNSWRNLISKRPELVEKFHALISEKQLSCIARTQVD